MEMLPIRLELRNFKSHTHSVIDFNFSSALVIGEKSGDPRRSNGSGKSSLLESLSFALYGESGDKSADDVVKKGQITCEVILDFTHDGQTYQIKRTRNAKYSKMITEFWRVVDDGRREKLHGDTNSNTNAIICDTIKCTYNVFLNSVYFRQGSFFDFTQGTFSTRQALLSSLLNLEDWAKYQKVAKAKFDRLDGEIEATRNSLLRSESAEASLRASQDALIDVTTQIDVINSENADLEGQILALEEAIISDSDRGRQASKIKELEIEHARLNKELKRLIDMRHAYDSTLVELNSSLTSQKNSIADKEAKIATLTSELADANIDLRKSDIVRMESSLVDGKAKTRQIHTQIETLTSGDQCITCGHEWTDLGSKQAELTLRQSDLDSLLAKIQRAEGKLAAARSDLEKILRKSADLKMLQLQLPALNDGMNTLLLRIASTSGQRSAMLEDILIVEKRLEETSSALGSISDLELLDSYAEKLQQLTGNKDRLKENVERARALFMRSGQLTAQIEALQSVLESRNREISHLDDCIKQATVYGQLTKAFGKDGVQAIIIDNVVDELTRAANAWLSEFSSEPMHLSFVTQKQGTKGEWKETFDIEINTRNGPQAWHSLSGGEKFIVSFAIRLAIGSIQARRMGGATQLLLLDEVSSSLDPYNIDVFVTIIRKLEKHMKIMVITHDPALKDEFETIITVKRTHSGSEVEIS
jgi:DNA repair exonuclease SbcCD ATPase subunit